MCIIAGRVARRARPVMRDNQTAGYRNVKKLSGRARIDPWRVVLTVAHVHSNRGNSHFWLLHMGGWKFICKQYPAPGMYPSRSVSNT